MFYRLSILLALASVAWLTSAQAVGAYRWVDENGLTHYSQTPPPDQQTTRIAPPPPPSDDGQKTWDGLDRQWQDMEIRNDARKKQEETTEKETEVQAAREKNCQAARHNLEILQGSTRKLIRTPDGEYHRVDPAVRQEQIEKAQKMIDENCD